MEVIKQYIKKNCKGPNQFSNWVAYPNVLKPGRLLMSAYPYRPHTKKEIGHSYPTKKDFHKF